MTLQDVTSFITPICGVAIAIFTYLNTKSIKAVSSKVTAVDTKVDENTAVTKENQTQIKEVKVQTDGINSKLVETSRQLGVEEGNRQGREDLKHENESLLNEPIKVEIVNEPIKVEAK